MCQWILGWAPLVVFMPKMNVAVPVSLLWYVKAPFHMIPKHSSGQVLRKFRPLYMLVRPSCRTGTIRAPSEAPHLHGCRCRKTSLVGNIDHLIGFVVTFGVYNDSVKAPSRWDLNPRHAGKLCCEGPSEPLSARTAARLHTHNCMPRVQIPPRGCLYRVIVDSKSHGGACETVYFAHLGHFHTHIGSPPWSAHPNSRKIVGEPS